MPLKTEQSKTMRRRLVEHLRDNPSADYMVVYHATKHAMALDGIDAPRGEHPQVTPLAELSSNQQAELQALISAMGG